MQDESVQQRAITVWKFKLRKYEKFQFVEMPAGAFVLSVGAQYKDPGRIVALSADDFEICVWAALDPESPKMMRLISFMETGAQYRPGALGHFVGALHIQTGGGPYVAHMFDSGKEIPLELWNDEGAREGIIAGAREAILLDP